MAQSSRQARNIEGVLGYAERPRHHGLFFMDTPGNDMESVMSMIAGGAVIVLFTTGLGTPVGSAIAPIIKITGNERTHHAMRRHIDVAVSAIVDGMMSVQDGGKKILSEVVQVASGKRTRSENLHHREFSITASAGPLDSRNNLNAKELAFSGSIGSSQSSSISI